MKYRLALDPHAQRQLAKLDPNTRRSVYDKLLPLEENPRPHGVLKLKGYSNGWRIRIDKLRALFLIEDDLGTVTVFDIDWRDKVYKRKA